MKTLIENSIAIYGMGHPDIKTVFNITNESERNHFRFKNLTKISGRCLTVWFSFSENDIITTEKSILLNIPKNKTENEIKEFIVNSINEYLNQ